MADPALLSLVLWAAWAALWWAWSRRAAPTERPEPLSLRLRHVVPTCLTLWLIFSPTLHGRLPPSFGAGWRWTGVSMIVLGFSLAIWARAHLGVWWSGFVELKRGHALVRTGPYAFLRHPIYAGFLAAVLGAALAAGRWPGVLGALILLPVYRAKARREEALMRETFGPTYDK